MHTMAILNIPMVLLSLFLVSFPSMLVSAESSSSPVEATGKVISLNNSTHSGVWAAAAYFDIHKGYIFSVSKDGGDVFVVTVAGDNLVFNEQGLGIIGTGFVGKNGILLEQGNGTATINQSGMEIRVNGDIVVSGKTVSFKTK